MKGGSVLAVFQQIGAPEIILILAILLLLFGAKRLPEMARSIGRSTKEFKKGMREATEEDEPTDQKPEEKQEEPASEQRSKSD